MPQSIRPPLVQVVIFVVLLPFVHQLFLNPGILPSTHKTKDVNFLNKLLGNRLQLKPATPNSCAGYIASYTIIITITITIIIIIIIITITITSSSSSASPSSSSSNKCACVWQDHQGKGFWWLWTRLVQFLPCLVAASGILEVHGIVLARRRRAIFSWPLLLKLFHLDKAGISETIEKRDLICTQLLEQVSSISMPWTAGLEQCLAIPFNTSFDIGRRSLHVRSRKRQATLTLTRGSSWRPVEIKSLRPYLSAVQNLITSDSHRFPMEMHRHVRVQKSGLVWIRTPLPKDTMQGNHLSVHA